MGAAAAGRGRGRWERLVSPIPTPRDVRCFDSAADLRDWLDADHATADELWLGYFKVKSAPPGER